MDISLLRMVIADAETLILSPRDGGVSKCDLAIARARRAFAGRGATAGLGMLAVVPGQSKSVRAAVQKKNVPIRKRA